MAAPGRPAAATVLNAALWAGALGGAAVTLLGWLASSWWVAALFEHFRVQQAVMLAAVALAALLARRWQPAGVAAAAALVNVVVVAPMWIAPAAPAHHGEPLRLLVVNVQQDNPDHARVARLLAESDADVVGLVEVDSRWLADLAPVTVRWPHVVLQPHDHDRFGLALYSKRPLRDAGVRTFGVPWPPALIATLDADGGPVTFVLVHPPPPVRASMAQVQARFLDALAAARASFGEHLVIMGDLNATPWSHAMRRLLARTGLRDSRRGFGLQASWPTATPVLRIPIDHVLVSARVTVLSRQVGPTVGSDHLPLRATIALARR